MTRAQLWQNFQNNTSLISTAPNSAPRNFRLYGSTTGTSWTLLIDKQEAVYTNLLYNHTDMSQYASDTNKYYNHFGLVVNALVGSATTLSFDEFFVYGVESTYTPITTNGNTKTLTIPRYNKLNNAIINFYNIHNQLSEQFDINNNPVSACHLTWSYASFLFYKF